MTLVLAALLAASSPGATDVEVWNEGVAAYDAGDATNALRILRPLLLSRTHGARAAEVVAKLEYDRGDLEEAAVAAQIALRAAPDDPKANRNFTRATDGLPAAREEARVKKALKEAEGRDPGALLLAAARDCRALMAESGAYRTNRAERAVALSDALSARAERLADAWLPVRELIARSVTNEQQAATVSAQIDAARRKTRDASRRIADFDPEAYPLLSDVESDFTRFVKLCVAPPAAIDEDLVAQSNAWLDVEPFNGRPWQREALDYTRAFRAKFPAWARSYEQQAQSDTNRPPFTAEDQAKVSALATELEKLQIECVEKTLPPEQETALGIIEEIRALLPRDPDGGGQGQQDRQQDQGQDQNRDRQQSQPPPERNDGGEDGGDSQERQPSEPQEDDGGGEPEDHEVETVLKKAQERSDEHEQEKKARMRRAPLPPNERDW